MWKQEWGFNWVYAAIAGARFVTPVAGKLFTPTGNKVIIPAEDGGSTTVNVRAVFGKDVDFTWNGYWAEPIDKSAVNYLYSWEIVGGNTEITLTASLSEPVQVFYAYYNGELAEKYQGVNVYPVPVPWKRSENDYTMDWAVDKVLDLIVFLYYEDLYRGYSQGSLRGWLWDEFKYYSSSRIPPLLYDNFMRGDVEKFDIAAYLDGISPDLYSGSRIVQLSDRRAFLFNINAADQADSVWFGYFLGVDDTSFPPFNLVNNLGFSIAGTNSNNVLHIQLNSARVEYSDKFTNPNYIFTHSIIDTSQQFRDFDLNLDQFWRIKNIYDDGSRVRAYIYSAGDVDQAVSRRHETLNDAGDVFYVYIRLTYSGAGTFTLFGVSNLSNDVGKPTGKSDLRFFARSSVNMNVEVQVLQDGDVSPRVYTEAITTSFSRHTINFSSFSPAIDNSKDITWIQFLITSPPADGFLDVTDICFGAKERWTELATHWLLVQFYYDRNNYNSPTSKFWISDFFINIPTQDRYPLCARLAISIREYGQCFWRGPTLVHYQHPLAPYLVEDTTALTSMVAMHNDAQREYYSDYGILGPIYPVHTRNDMENIPLCGAEYFDSFVFWQDYPECLYAYGQYWAFYKAAEYWCHTGDGRIKQYLDNWVNWILTYDFKDMPTDFNNGAITKGQIDAYADASACLGLLFYYCRSGDLTVLAKLREGLDWLTSRWNQDQWEHASLHWVYGTAKGFRLFGLVANGGPPNAIYRIEPRTADIETFLSIKKWFFDNSGDYKPNILNSDYIPFAYLEDVSMWDFAPNYIMESQCGTLEALVNLLPCALEYGRYSGDYSWSDRLKSFVLLWGTNMSTKLDIINLALDYLGELPVTSLEETDNRALTVLLAIYNLTRDELLREHSWNFAIKRATLTVGEEYGDFYRYPIPQDCLRLLTVDDSFSWRTEYGYIVCNQSNSIGISYISRITNEALFDTKFSILLATKLAAEISYNITGDSAREANLHKLFYSRLAAAKAVDGQEGGIMQLEVTDWLNSRY